MMICCHAPPPSFVFGPHNESWRQDFHRGNWKRLPSGALFFQRADCEPFASTSPKRSLFGGGENVVPLLGVCAAQVPAPLATLCRPQPGLVALPPYQLKGFSRAFLLLFTVPPVGVGVESATVMVSQCVVTVAFASGKGLKVRLRRIKKQDCGCMKQKCLSP